jgi:hypothetical protein
MNITSNITSIYIPTWNECQKTLIGNVFLVLLVYAGIVTVVCLVLWLVLKNMMKQKNPQQYYQPSVASGGNK